MERRAKDKEALLLNDRAHNMKFVDQSCKVTNFITDKDLEKFKLSYLDISPFLEIKQKVAMWTKQE